MKLLGVEISRVRAILSVSMPIIAGMLSKNILSLVDAAMIGFLGDEALAATGLSGFIFFSYTAVFLGMSESVQVYVARYYGAKEPGNITKPLNSGLSIIVCLSIIVTIIAWFTAPFVLSHMSPSPTVTKLGLSYFRWLILAIPAQCIVFVYRSYWNGVNQPSRFLMVLAVMHLFNIILNYLLIFGKFGFPELGVEGAGLATFTAYTLGSLAYVLSGLSWVRYPNYLRQFANKSLLKDMFHTSLPSATRQLFFFMALSYFMWAIGHIGHQNVAIANVIITLSLIIILPGVGFGLTALSFVSQALGRNNGNDAEQWAWDIVKIASAVTFTVGLIGMLFPTVILGAFIHNPDTLAMAVPAFRLQCLTIWIEVTGLVFLNALIGSGKASTVMQTSIACQVFVFIPLTFIAGPILKLPLLWLFAAWVMQHVVAASSYVYLWRYRFK